VVSHIKSRNAHTLFWPIKVSGCKYRNLYQRVLTTTTLAIHHSDFNFQFVLDLAGAHFSIETIAQMKENLAFSDKTTINVPQARLKENLWGILAQKIYEGGWKATTQQELISRIQSRLKKIDSNFLQSLDFVKKLTQIFYKA
jgi:hypothetical protein